MVAPLLCVSAFQTHLQHPSDTYVCLKLALAEQVDTDTMAWFPPDERHKPHNCAPPKDNKVPRESVLGR